MSRILLPCRSLGWITILAAVLGASLLVNSCGQNPIVADHPGSEWNIHVDMSTMMDSVLYRTPFHGNSQTLYTGYTDEGSREAGILIKFALIDTTLLPRFKYARLILFRRHFSDSEPVSSSPFSLSIIESDTAQWSESDTGLTVGDIGDLAVVYPYETGLLQTDSVTTFPTGVSTRSYVEHLAFGLDSLLLRRWATGDLANNGFLIRREDGGSLVGFYTRDELEYSPYIAIGLHDTSSSKEVDTSIVAYHRPTADLSIYPTLVEISALPEDDLSDGMIHLDHSNGLIGHVNFSNYLNPDTTSMVAGAELILHTNEVQQPLLAGAVEILVARHAESLAEGDSARILHDYDIVYVAGDDSLVIDLRDYLRSIVAGSIPNHGVRISVLPKWHDFDHLVIWGSQAPAGLKPRLEVTYATPFDEATRNE